MLGGKFGGIDFAGGPATSVDGVHGLAIADHGTDIMTALRGTAAAVLLSGAIKGGGNRVFGQYRAIAINQCQALALKADVDALVKTAVVTQAG
ncbi:hypothetical protein AU14_14950 [Marinobacter similis]|uniref:Uncharacterized protein n=1 Tax=Marinobacter similis TaxID=1420916 RepID=W5YMP5_9GAMM|nr:hypothetical protein AU14_14950 [Marinobacter similis]